MDFIESALIMVPALTGMDLAVYDGSSETLAQFEDKFCFSPELQPFYTQKGLTRFLKTASEVFIYDIEDTLGMHLIIAQAGNHWVLLGPYVEEGWSEQAARLLLMKLNASEAVLFRFKSYRCKFPIVQQDYALKALLLITEHMGCETKIVKTIRLARECQNEPFAFSDEYANALEVNRRYSIEDRLINAIIYGDVSKAIQARKESLEANINFRYFRDSRQDQLVGITIERTIIRMAAKWAGLSPVRIDAIIQEFAQKMCFAISRSELDHLTLSMIERFCSEIRKQRESGCSSIVRQAIDYMEVNLSKPMTTTEIAQAAGVERKSFVERFRKETKMTVKEYLANRRCAIAAQLLLDSTAYVQDVAAYVGYPDSSYFSKVFKANTGVSPQEYRNIRRPAKANIF